MNVLLYALMQRKWYNVVVLPRAATSNAYWPPSQSARDFGFVENM